MDAKGAKRSIKMWSTNFNKSFFKNIWLYMNSRLSKIRSVYSYIMPRTVYFGWICRMSFLLLFGEVFVVFLLDNFGRAFLTILALMWPFWPLWDLLAFIWPFGIYVTFNMLLVSSMYVAFFALFSFWLHLIAFCLVFSLLTFQELFAGFLDVV